ncbi:MAG: ABC transporter substrate-binding protein [Alphaproteobacteria bacterium]
MRLIPMSAALPAVLLSVAAAAQEIYVPVLVPVTGFLALEGTSQRNGAEMALDEGAQELEIRHAVTDTNVSPEAAVTAMERALGEGDPLAVVAPMLGTQMLALMPLAEDYAVPLLTVSGTATITEQGNPWVFRFFPGDAVVKVAHADYAVNVMGMQRPALIYQTTAYGQSGHAHLKESLAALDVVPVLEEGLPVEAREMLPVLAKAVQAGADGLILHLHAGPTALVIRQAQAMGLELPIAAGSAMHQPATADLLEPAELEGVCAESGSAPNADHRPEVQAWAQAYRDRYGIEPDAFALGQYDAVRMLLAAAADGAQTAEAARDWLAINEFPGLAMTYRSDGSGSMAHDAVIICYDGTSRTPVVARRYRDIDGVLTGE